MYLSAYPDRKLDDTNKGLREEDTASSILSESKSTLSQPKERIISILVDG